MLSSRFFALRAVVGSSGPEAEVQSSSVSGAVLSPNFVTYCEDFLTTDVTDATDGKDFSGLLFDPCNPCNPWSSIAACLVAACRAVSWPLPASGPEDYSPEGGLVNLENAVQPRMDTDGHGYQAVAQNRRLTQEVSEKRGPKSVFIRVNRWLMIFSADSNCGM